MNLRCLEKKVTKNYSPVYVYFKGVHECKAFQAKNMLPPSCLGRGPHLLIHLFLFLRAFANLILRCLATLRTNATIEAL